MNFKKLYVDNIFLKALQKIAVQEKWLGDPGDLTRHRNHLRGKILLYLTLFEEVDSPSLLLFDADCTRLIDTGLIKKDARLFNCSRSHFERELELGDLSKYHRAIKEIKTTAHQLLTVNSTKIIDQVYDKATDESEETVFYGDILKDYEYILYTSDEDIELRKPDLVDLKDTLENTRYTIEELLFISMNEQVPFVSDLLQFQRPRSNRELKLMEDALYIVRTKLSDELIYLPDPHNLNDVLRMRSDPSLKRLRSVLQEWTTYLQKGEYALEKKARKDIRKADLELRTLNHWRGFKNSPLNFWMNSIGGHIPILSNILTAIYMIGGIYESYTKRNSNWIMLGK